MDDQCFDPLATRETSTELGTGMGALARSGSVSAALTQTRSL